MSELKSGDKKTFEVGDQKLIVEPIPYGRLKRLIRLVAEVTKHFDSKEVKDNLLVIVPKIVDEYVDDFIPDLFNPKTHTFLTKEWIEENMTIPVTKEIVIAAMTVNGLADFFVKKPLTAASPESLPAGSPSQATPSENTRSTTPQGLPTDGALATSTS